VYRGLVGAEIDVDFKLIPLIAFPRVSKTNPKYERLAALTSAMEAVTDGVTHDLLFPGPAASPELQAAYGV
jgi:hypothetical protein